MSVVLNTKHLSGFINEEEYKAIYPQVEAAHKQLEAKNGPGNDFLGWMYLPRDYDKEEFARIKEAAKKIREDSEVLVVAGIGGSYLGARAVIEAVKGDVVVSMYNYDRPSYTGCKYEIECYFPTWAIPKDHKVTKALEDAYKNLYGETRLGNAETEEMRKARPLTDKWTFSTNGVSIMGRNGIPCIGFGPGAEAQAHAPNEKTWKIDLVRCAAVYAALPGSYCK